MYLFRLNINNIEVYFYLILFKVENKLYVILYMSYKIKCYVDIMDYFFRIKRDKL